MSNNENRENLPDEKKIFNELVGICNSKCKGTKKMECLKETLETNVKGDRNTLCALKAELNASKENNNVNLLLSITALVISALTAGISVFSIFGNICVLFNVLAVIVLIVAIGFACHGLVLCLKLMKSKKNSYIEIALSEYESSLDKTIN